MKLPHLGSPEQAEQAFRAAVPDVQELVEDSGPDEPPVDILLIHGLDEAEAEMIADAVAAMVGATRIRWFDDARRLRSSRVGFRIERPSKERLFRAILHATMRTGPTARLEMLAAAPEAAVARFGQFCLDHRDSTISDLEPMLGMAMSRRQAESWLRGLGPDFVGLAQPLGVLDRPGGQVNPPGSTGDWLT